MQGSLFLFLYNSQKETFNKMQCKMNVRNINRKVQNCDIGNSNSLFIMAYNIILQFLNYTLD